MAAKTEVQGGINMDLIKALGHPLRFHALQILNTRVASPNEISKELGVPVNKLAYHVRILQKANLIELVKTEQRRGATEHYYRATSRAELTDEDWMHLPPNVQGEISLELLKAIGADVTNALKASSFDARNDRRLTWLPMKLDQEGWREAMAILAEAEEKLVALETAAAERQLGSDESLIPTSITLMGFELPSA